MGPPRTAAMNSLVQFKTQGTGPLLSELKREERTRQEIDRFRSRVSTGNKQFGVFSQNSKPGRILEDCAAAVVLGDAVLTFTS